MNVYFIRHGETISNTNKTIQGSDDLLTEQGIKEARMLTERIKDETFDIVISSPLMRCIQTAEVYSSVTHADYVIHELFTKIKPNSSLVGKAKEDPAVVYANTEHANNKHNESWKLEDEESFDEFKTRAINALTYLSL